MFGKEEMGQLVECIWGTMLGWEVHALDGATWAVERQSLYVSRIHIHGPFEADILLECPETPARHAASAMLNLEPDQVTAGDIRDVVGELTNMLAGNLKALLPELGSLGLPQVTEVETQPQEDGVATTQIMFQCPRGCFRVSCLTQDGETLTV